MGEDDLIRTLLQNAQGWPFLLLIAWAELRLLPRALDSIGWQRAIGAKLGVTQADADAHRPAGWIRRGSSPPPPPPPASASSAAGAVLLLLLALVPLSGCAVFRSPNAAISAQADRTLRAFDLFVAASEPAPIVSSSSWANLRDATRESLFEVRRAADE